MNQLRVLSLTTLLLMLASRLPGQFGQPPPQPQQGVQIYGQPVVCNDGTILFSVARAYREANVFSADTWQVEGWYNVEPGKCEKIGPVNLYYNGGWFGKDSVTLLAFAFRDSTGTWGALTLRPFNYDSLWHPSNQQFCFRPEGAAYDRDSPGGDLPRSCDGKQTGYQMVPASFEYRGPGYSSSGYSGQDELHVKLGPSDRAIPLGPQTSSGGASQRSSSTASSRSNGDASPSMCGKVSCWDLVLQRLAQAVARDNEAQRAAANANNDPPPPQPTVAPRPVVSPAPATLPQRPRLAPIMIGKVDVSHLAGLQRGDTADYVSSLFGPPTSKNEQDSSAFGGYPHTRSDGLSIRVNYNLDNVLSDLKIYSKGSRGTDPLLGLFGKSESDAVALLGSPKKREYAETIDDTYLIWSFAVDGRPAEPRPLPQNYQTLTLHFTTGVGCNSITLVW